MYKLSNKLAISTIALLVLISGCGKKEETKVSDVASTPTETTQLAEVPATPPTPPPVTTEISAEDTAKLATLPAPYNKANLANGKKQFALCKACHTIVNGAPNGVGPNMHNLIGRKAGTVDKFTYSDAMKNSGKTWDIATLDAYLKAPKTFIPSNKMAFAGIPNDDNRRDVIAYIAVESAK